MEKLRNKKENIIVFLIIIVLALIFCGIFLKFHMITDTYWNIGVGYEKYKLTPLEDGRIINYISLSIAQITNIPFEAYQLIMMILSILFYSISVYLIYNHFIEIAKNTKILNKIIILLGSFLIIFNPLTIESFGYTEMVIALSILLLTKSAIWIDKEKILNPVILTVLACLCYQGTINFLITLSILLFAIKEKHNIKEWTKQLAKVGIIAVIALVAMLLTLNILNSNQTRLGNDITIFEKIVNIILASADLITLKTFNLYQSYLLIICIAITLILILIQIKKDVRPIFKYLFIILIAILSCTVPIYMQKLPAISARIVFSVGSIIGISIIYALFQKDENNSKAKEYILLIVSFIAIGINMYNYISIGIMNIKSQKEEEKYARQINECILKYEENTGIKITKAAFVREKSYETTYAGIISNTLTHRGMVAEYSNIHCLNYYTNRNLEKAQMDKEIYEKYFQTQDDKEFSEEQVKFKDDTVYICLY